MQMPTMLKIWTQPTQMIDCQLLLLAQSQLILSTLPEHHEKNPNFFGTYTYIATTTRTEHWQNMAKRIQDSNLYFCKEHTYSKYRGTVHGAYLSGISAANDVKEKVNKIKVIIVVFCTVGGALLIFTGVLIYFKCRKPVPSPDTANVNAEPNYNQFYNNIKAFSGIDSTAVYSMEVMRAKAA